MIKIDLKEHENTIDAYAELEQVMLEEREGQLQELTRIKGAWIGPAAMALQVQYPTMLTSGAYQTALEQVTGMRQTMEEALPELKRLKGKCESFPACIGGTAGSNTTGILKLDETVIPTIDSYCDTIKSNSDQLKSVLQAIMNKCSGLVDFGGDYTALDMACQKIDKIIDLKAEIDDYKKCVEDIDADLEISYSTWANENILLINDVSADGNVDLSATQVTTLSENNIYSELGNGISTANFAVNDIMNHTILNDKALLASKWINHGIIFSTKTDKKGTIYIVMDNYKNLTHANIQGELNNWVSNSTWTDYDIRRLINDGLPVYKGNGNPTRENKLFSNMATLSKNEIRFSEYVERLAKTPTGRMNDTKDIIIETFIEEINVYEKVRGVSEAKGLCDFSNFKNLSKVDKVDDVLTKVGKLGKITGVAGDFITAGVEVYDNNYNADTGEWEFSTESVVSTVSDITIDIGTSAGAAALGAGIGSLIVPPIGTVVGAVAGIAIDIGINWEFDLDGDGESNSAVGLLKDGVDFVTQKIMDLI